ncbi:MAG: response regulator transcription factor [Betaproteobacteria bacterium]|nr:response regulator transcription factor [Betaproteobacteria bacterium]
MTEKQKAPLIYIVEDDDALRDSLCWLIESAGHRVVAFPNAECFLAAYQPGAGACLVLDVRMPGMSGLQLQEMLLRLHQNIPTIFVTGHGDVPMAVNAIKRGALDFIEKPFRDQELLTKIERAVQIERELADPRARYRLIAPRLATLTIREREVMRRVVDGRPNKCIAKDLAISIKTVEAHRSKMMEKLGVNSVAELVRVVVLAEASDLSVESS